MESLLGYCAAALIGISLGLIGGGGSILTVPILVYCFHIEPVLATAYSLFIVGTTSLAGVVISISRKLVDLRAALVLSPPCLAAVYVTRRFIIPEIPEIVFAQGRIIVTKGMLLMVLFGVLMLVCGSSMILKTEPSSYRQSSDHFNYYIIFAAGILVGVVTGLVGMGGGFLIIPALIFFARLPMKTAIGTSLTVIAVKSLAGFAGDIQAGQRIDYPFIITITCIATLGIAIGMYASTFVEGQKLKAGFGWFVIVISSLLLAKQIV